MIATECRLIVGKSGFALPMDPLHRPTKLPDALEQTLVEVRVSLLEAIVRGLHKERSH